MALPLYAATLFVSAFILFLVQPMIGKMILPKLGGTPQVWNTCMVFFQTILLAGYAYTHFVSTRLKLRQQLLLHCTLILLPFLVLGVLRQPFNITTWTPELGVNPIPSALYILLIIVGLPFFVVSTTAPLLQKWFAYTGHPAAKDPYFLYGASNLGSMLALLFYPTIIEPWLKLNDQAWLWTGGFGLLVITVLACVAFVWKPAPGTQELDKIEPPPVMEMEAVAADKPVDTAITAKAPVGATTAVRATPRPAPSIGLAKPEDELTLGRQLKWIALAAVPSSMMLGVTTYITTDLSPVPMIWLIPLTLYLLSFILVFARWPVVWVEEPHKWMVYIQPIAVAGMLVVYFMNIAHENLKLAIFFAFAGFFFTTMVCHGELAKDRPGTRHLTKFYLMMSVGGMLGGMFNGLFAPNIPALFEFPAAIIAACFLRPWLSDFGYLDRFVAGLIDPTAGEGAVRKKGGKGVALSHEPSPKIARSLDVVCAVGLGLLTLALIMMLYNSAGRRGGDIRWHEDPLIAAYLVPLLITCLFFAQPLRYALSVALIMLVGWSQTSGSGAGEYRTRGYFGLIKVSTAGSDRSGTGPYRQMIHGHINHGMNFLKPSDDKEWGDPKKDYSRHATTYYHRFGPAGIVMERFCWFHEPENHFNSDARICASIVGSGFMPMGALVPADQYASMWSEPPFATIGLGTGTMASYARPFQHMHYYEIDNLVKRLSLRPAWKNTITYLDFQDDSSPFYKATAPYFTYLRDALGRGAHVQVLMGDARLRMSMPYKNHYSEDPERGGGPERFYHMMVVDAFSSDAIPAHLITQQGIKMYFDHLSEDGILCVHTSNRFVDLVKVVADVSAKLDLACLRGHDEAPYEDKVGHFTSEWVMVARKSAYLKRLSAPPGYAQAVREKARKLNRPVGETSYWNVPDVYNRYAWTDDFYNILQVMR